MATSDHAPSAASPPSARRDSIIQAAVGVFLRYGYKKTSMDDLARAAGLSRQGLYLHFATKEALFEDGVLYLTQATRATSLAALGNDELAIEERLLGAFLAIKSTPDGEPMSDEHMTELFETAAALVGPVLEDLEQTLITDLQHVLQASGVAAKWKDVGLTAKDLAQHLYAASHGIKHYVKTAADYKERMRSAVRLICRTQRK